MTRDEYNATRVLPERKRATRNGKRSLDAFVKSVRDRMLIEHPEKVHDFDIDLIARLDCLYFFFTKYITARWDTKGMAVATMASDHKQMWYTDNLLDEVERGHVMRGMFKDFLRERIDAAL